MSTLEAPTIGTEKHQSIVGTQVASDDSLAVNAERFEAARQEWDVSVLAKLTEWAENPELLRDEGVIEPSLVSIHVAINVGTQLRNQEDPPPHRVVPNGDGGIAFEWWSSSKSVTIEFFEDGEVEVARFADSKLISRDRIN